MPDLPDHLLSQSEKDEREVAERGLLSPLRWTSPDGRDLSFTNPQILAHDFGVRHDKFVLSLDKGMGKTVTYLTITRDRGAQRIVILVPKNGFSTQRREILNHFPEWSDRFTIVEGQAPKRAKLWNEDKGEGPRIFITTPQTLQADMGWKRGLIKDPIIPKWVRAPDMIIEDEFQRYLRTRDSQQFAMQAWNGFNPSMAIYSSGSAVSRGPFQLWPVLHLIDPKLWSSYWRYVKTYHEVSEGRFSKHEIGSVKNEDGWRRAMQPYLFHRRKDPRDYPPKIRQFLDVVLPSDLQRIHDVLRKELFAVLSNGELLMARNVLEATYKVRMFLICPKTLDASLPYGPGLEGILEDMKDAEKDHFVISTPFKAPIPHICEFFRQNGVRTYVLSGSEGLDTDALDRVIRTWTSTGGVIIQTIQYAQSYELLAADNMYFLGYLHDPEANAQAEDRIHREASDKKIPKNIYYVRHLDTFDERVVDAIMHNASNVRRLFDNPLALAAAAQRGDI